MIGAFIIGLFGSLHCVGMCGPLVMALPLTASDKKNVVLSSLTYNFGRTMTYATMGLIMGSLGWCISLGGSQKIFSIVLGGLLIYSGLCYYYPALKLNSVLPLNKAKTFLYDKLFKNFNLNNKLRDLSNCWHEFCSVFVGTTDGAAQRAEHETSWHQTLPRTVCRHTRPAACGPTPR